MTWGVSAFILFAQAHSQKLAELGFEPKLSASEPGEALMLWLCYLLDFSEQCVVEAGALAESVLDLMIYPGNGD